VLIHWGGGRIHHIGILITCLGVFFCGELLAGPVGLPDSARPGAVRPGQEDRSKIPEGPPAEVLDVPPVIDRPFDPDECPCAVVQEFRLLDAEDMPKFDVDVAEIQALLSEKIARQPEGGFSIGQLQGVANEIRAYYRERGLILAQVVVPVQTVQGGVVDLQVFVGRLGRVIAEGNEMYSSAVLEKAFGHLVGEPVSQANIEAALLRLTDYPGLTVFGVFQPGRLVGTADIVLKVQKEKRFDVAMRIDNQGTKETGQHRFRTVIDWNNFTNGADRLTMTVQQSYNPKNSVFKAVDYERFLSRGFKFGAFANANKFAVGGEFRAQNIRAETEEQGVFLEKSWQRSRQQNFSTRFGLSLKESKTDTGFAPTDRDNLTVFTLTADYDSVDTFSIGEDGAGGGINFATLELYRGVNDLFGAMGSASEAAQRPFGFRPSRQGGPPEQRFAEGQFTKLFATYTRLQTLTKHQSLLFRAEWQWSDDLLVPMEQYSAGGPDNVRAFSVAQILWDRAYFWSLEYIINAPFIADKPAFDNRTWGELLQFSIFYDMAIGRLNDPLPNDQQTYDNIRGAGFGLRFNVPGSIESRFLMAWALGSERDEVGNDRTPQFWGDLTYSF